MESKQRAKEPSKEQLIRRIQHSPLHLERTKHTNSVYFSDKGLRLTVDDTENYALVGTNFHTHVFMAYTSSGFSRPYLYLANFVTMTLEHEKEIATKDGLSYTRLFEVLKAQEDQTQYNIAKYVDWWLYNIFAPLYEIGEGSASSFLVYETYLHNIARNYITLDEHTEDMTTGMFLAALDAKMRELTKGMPDEVMFAKKTDEERMREEMDALSAIDAEMTISKTEVKEENENDRG